jgi:hypothetical protein
MILRRCQSLVILAVLSVGFSWPAHSQPKLVDPQAARDCGCTLRKWPLLSDFVSKTMPSLNSLQPETVLPHYVDAGCGNWPGLPAQGIYGEVRYTAPVSLDLFIDHDWHDFNIFAKLNGDAHYLNSALNDKNDNSFLCYNQTDKSCPATRGETLMEIEWDTKHYPERFWATAGDRIWMTGRYVWDCGHPAGYHTEIHPPKAIALTRLAPYVFPGDDSPSFTNQSYIYVNGKSGMKNYNFKTVQGIESVVFNGYRDQPVANQVYEFDLPLPAKPQDYSGQPVAQVLELPFGGPPPELSIDATQRFVHVKYPLKLGDTSPDRKFAAVIVAGWRAPVDRVRFRKLTVRVEELQILKPHNMVSSADWKLWLNINGQWTKIEGPSGGEGAAPRLDSLLNIDGLLGAKSPTLKINRNLSVIVPETDDARLTIQVAGWVNFYDALFGAREDILTTSLNVPSGLTQVFSQLSTSQGRIGLFFRQFSRADNFGVGSRQSGPRRELSKGFEHVDGDKGGNLPNTFTETQGDFAVTYSISEAPL